MDLRFPVKSPTPVSVSGLIAHRHCQLRRRVSIRPQSTGFVIGPSLESNTLAAIVAFTTFSAACFNHFLTKDNLGDKFDYKGSSSFSEGLNQLRRKLVDQVIRNLLSRNSYAFPCDGSLAETVNSNGVDNYYRIEGKVESNFVPAADKATVEAESITSQSETNPSTAAQLGSRSEGNPSIGNTEEHSREEIYTFFSGKYPNSETLVTADKASAGIQKVYFSRTSSSNGVSKSERKVKKESVPNEDHDETIKRQVPPGDGFSHKISEKNKTSRTVKRSKNGTKSNPSRIPPPSFQSNQVEYNLHEDGSDHLFVVYNDLLKLGRLSECIDLLEHLNHNEKLNMNKVYHADFFKLCRRKKNARAAFRFFKLITSPTLSTFNMLMSVCASAQDADGAFQVLQLLQENGMKADLKLYTTLLSSCAKSGRVDAMFEVFHEMVNSGVEPNVNTYGALIDGCARAGQVAKAFGAYGIMRSKNVKPDRAIFNALISACGQSGAVDRAFDVLTEMKSETEPVDPDPVTIGALMMACAKAGQVDRALEVYNMIRKYDIKGSPEMYTIAVNCCSQTGDWNLACLFYDDMIERGVVPDEIFFSALIDVAGHAGKVDAAFDVLKRAKSVGSKIGVIPYSSLMGACSNSKNWEKALELYEDMKSINLKPTVPTFNALITALCNADQLPTAIEILSEMRTVFRLRPNIITYSMLLVACERVDDLTAGAMLLSLAKEDSVLPNLLMHKCIIGMCLHRFEKACSIGEPVLSVGLDRPKIQNEWSSLALKVYREAVAAGQKPTMELLSQVLGCLKLPYDAALKTTLFQNLGVGVDLPKSYHFRSLLEGFGEYDSRAFFLLEEAASSGIVPYVSFKENPVVVDAKKLQIHITEVYILTILKSLKHHLAGGGKLPNLTVLLPLEKSEIMTAKGQKTVNLATRNGQSVASLLRRIGIPFKGSESRGQIRINGISLRRWLQPRTDPLVNKKPEESASSLTRIGRIISNQQRSIRTGNLSLD